MKTWSAHRFALGLSALCLVGVGVLMQHSVALGGIHMDSLRWWPLVAAAGAFLVAQRAPLDALVRRAPWLFGATILLALLPLAGHGARNVHRWFSLTHLLPRWLASHPFFVQPAELLKLGLILVLAHALGKNEDDRGGGALARCVGLTALAVLPALLSPDLGSALLLGLVAATMLVVEPFTPGAKAGALFAILTGIPTFLRFGLRSYQQARLASFFVADPLGAGYQSEQALRLISSGGLWGQGIGSWAGTEPHPLPQASSDFIFAVWAHETGLWGVAALLGAFGLLVGTQLRITASAPSLAARRVGLGITALFFWQSALNLAMVVRLIPVVGVPLPLVSRGGSTLVVCAICLGLCWSMASRKSEV